MTGLKHTTKDLPETVEFLKKMINKKKYSRIVAIGCSAGGFAAILYGILLKFDKVLAFSPQVVLNEKKERIIKDTYNAPNTCKWLTNLKQYKDDVFYHKCLDLSNFKPYDTEIEIHYALRANKGSDKNHADYLCDPKCRVKEYNSNKVNQNAISIVYSNNSFKMNFMVKNGLVMNFTAIITIAAYTFIFGGIK